MKDGKHMYDEIAEFISKRFVGVWRVMADREAARWGHSLGRVHTCLGSRVYLLELTRNRPWLNSHRIKIEQSYAKELQNLVKSTKPCADSG